MTHRPDLHQDVSNKRPPTDRSDVPVFNLYLNGTPSVSRYVCLATQTLFEHNLIPPEVNRLAQVVEAALRAQALYFAAAVYHPDREDLHRFFETFVLTCVNPPENGATHELAH